jgi:hypothetical protein
MNKKIKTISTRSTLAYLLVLFAILLSSSISVRNVLGESGKTTISNLSTLSFIATPSVITVGQPTVLSWSVLAVDDSAFCELKDSTGQVLDSSGIDANGNIIGSLSVTPTVNTTYTQNCQSGIEAPVSAPVTITVNPVPNNLALSLTASPTEITIGGSSNLTWSATGFVTINLLSCTLKGSDGVDIISPKPPLGSSGAVSVTPTVVGTSAYILNCQYDTEVPTSLLVNVTVKPSISITNFIVTSPSSARVPSGETALLSWVVTDSVVEDPIGAGIKCTVSTGGTPILPLDKPAVFSNFAVNPIVTSTYLLTCKKDSPLQTVTSALLPPVEVTVINSLVINASFFPASSIPSSGISFNIIDSSGNLYPGSPYILTSLSTPPWTMTLEDIDPNLYYITFDPIPGYTTPEPDNNILNDDKEHNTYPSPLFDDPYYSGRRIYVHAGQTNTMSITYRKESTLKQLAHTTAETLLFSPIAGSGNRQWDLLRGVASISTDGVNWQTSIAEILSVGTMAQVTIVKSGSHYIVAGGSADYKIHFDAEDTKNPIYSATLTDTINVSGGQNNKVTITGATITPDSIDTICKDAGITITGTSVIDNVSIPKKVTFNLPGVTRGCSFEVIVTLNIDETIVPNTTIQDTADIVLAEGGVGSDTFTTLAVGPFTQETVGGDIYAKGDLDFGQLPANKFGGKYVLGSDGNVQSTSSASEFGWTLGQYAIRSGSTADFSPDACTISGSACKAMNDNIAKLMKGKNALEPNTPSGNFNLNPSAIPEGGVFYKTNSDLDIGSGEGLGPVLFKGKGTIIVENRNVHIKNDIKYDPSSPNSILGIIVKNGNVIIDPSVGEVNAIFYIYSETGASGGSFQVNSSLSGIDIQLKIKGAVIASGKSSLEGGIWVRKDAFVLARKYAGNADTINQAIIDGKSNAEIEALFDPAEWFIYDSRVIVIPPPGFGGKIAGGL